MVEPDREGTYGEEDRPVIDFNSAMSAGLLIGLPIALFSTRQSMERYDVFLTNGNGSHAAGTEAASFFSGAHLALSVITPSSLRWSLINSGGSKP